MDAAGAAARGEEDEAGEEAESDECVSFERITPAEARGFTLYSIDLTQGALGMPKIGRAHV